MPIEHETPPETPLSSAPASPLTPVEILAARVLQRSSHLGTQCPPDEIRPDPTERLPPASSTVAVDGDIEDRLEQIVVEGLSISGRPLSVASSISDRRRDAYTVDAPVSPSPPPDFAAAEEVGKAVSPVAPRKAVSPVAPVSNAPRQYTADIHELKPLPKYSSSFLRPGSKFKGTQQSDRMQYNVEVEIKYVDMSESFLCGYLKIEGLTTDHPSLTTFFEGEIIGSKYSFETKEASWGSSRKVDEQHWQRFPAYAPLKREAQRKNLTYRDWTQREHLFMRWKEYFLVPDHRVKAISGASFEGFYYICFNQITGSVSGIYFHAKSEKYQQLELERVEDKGCMASIDFR